MSTLRIRSPLALRSRQTLPMALNSEAQPNSKGKSEKDDPEFLSLVKEGIAVKDKTKDEAGI